MVKISLYALQGRARFLYESSSGPGRAGQGRAKKLPCDGLCLAPHFAVGRNPNTL